MNDSLWALLTDEELAAQADEWRYAAERDAGAKRWGRARWSMAMSRSAEEHLIDRIMQRHEKANMGMQLALDVAGRVAPDDRPEKTA